MTAAAPGEGKQQTKYTDGDRALAVAMYDRYGATKAVSILRAEFEMPTITTQGIWEWKRFGHQATDSAVQQVMEREATLKAQLREDALAMSRKMPDLMDQAIEKKSFLGAQQVAYAFGILHDKIVPPAKAAGISVEEGGKVEVLVIAGPAATPGSRRDIIPGEFADQD